MFALLAPLLVLFSNMARMPVHQMDHSIENVSQIQEQVFPPNIVGRPTNFPGPGDMFVGACYQPIDRSPEQIVADIAIMKSAGFNVVRMGDLSWDSFEPSEGEFEFAWFDRIVKEMHANGIRVILDI